MVVCSKQLLADLGELELRVRELPFAIGFRLDGRAQGAAENLMSKTYARELDIRAVYPDVCN